MISTCDGEQTSKESAFLVSVSYLCLELTAAYKMKSWPSYFWVRNYLPASLEISISSACISECFCYIYLTEIKYSWCPASKVFLDKCSYNICMLFLWKIKMLVLQKHVNVTWIGFGVRNWVLLFFFLQALSSCLILPGDTTVISSSWDNHMCVFIACWLYWTPWSALIVVYGFR